MSGADSTTEVTPTGRYEAHSLSLGFLGAHKVHNSVKFHRPTSGAVFEAGTADSE